MNEMTTICATMDIQAIVALLAIAVLIVCLAFGIGYFTGLARHGHSNHALD